MLQNLAFLGEDGQVYGVRPAVLSNRVPPQMVGAWLDKEGEFRSIHDLQNLNLGAWEDEDELQDLMFSREDFGQIALGLLEGALFSNGLGNYSTCLDQSPMKAYPYIESAITKFRTMRMGTMVTNTKAGLWDIAMATQTMLVKMILCAKPEDLNKITSIYNLINSFYTADQGSYSYQKFASHVGNAIYYNGLQIFRKLGTAVKKYGEDDMRGFGRNLGMSLTVVLLGDSGKVEVDEFKEAEETTDVKTAQRELAATLKSSMPMTEEEEEKFYDAEEFQDEEEDSDDDVFYDAEEFDFQGAQQLQLLLI